VNAPVAATEPSGTTGSYLPQQALASSQHLDASRQQSCGAAQQGFSLAQHSLFLAQQPALVVAAQQAFSLPQQAILALQQSPGFSSAGAPVAINPNINNKPAIDFNNMIHLGFSIRVRNRVRTICAFFGVGKVALVARPRLEECRSAVQQSQRQFRR
jgi:hypothetical protein